MSEVKKELPQGWSWADFPKICFTLSDNGKKLKQKQYLDEGAYPVIDQGSSDIAGFTNDETLVFDGEFPIVAFGDHTRRFKKVSKKFVVGADGVKLFKPSSDLNFDYILKLLRISKFEDRGYSRHFQFVKKLHLPIAPLAEQTRIVDKIDELFSSIEAGERAIKQARAGVARYRKAILKAAVTGELTADWRDENPTKESAKDLLARILTARFEAWEKSELAKLDAKGKARPETEKQWEKFRARYKPPVEPKLSNEIDLPVGWHSASIDALIFRVTKGSSPKWQGFDYQDKGIIFVRSQNVGWGHLQLDEVAYLDDGFNTKNPRSMIREGDLLLNIVGASVGRAAIADKRLDGANSNQAVAALRPIERASADWILRYFLSTQGQQIIHHEKVDVARANFNLNQIAEVFIPLPPLAEQVEIVNRVEQALSKADAVEATLDAQSRAAKALKQAVLKIAFEGKLVPQNPKDEPASELLKRIRAAS